MYKKLDEKECSGFTVKGTTKSFGSKGYYNIQVQLDELGVIEAEVVVARSEKDCKATISTTKIGTYDARENFIVRNALSVAGSLCDSVNNLAEMLKSPEYAFGYLEKGLRIADESGFNDDMYMAWAMCSSIMEETNGEALAVRLLKCNSYKKLVSKAIAESTDDNLIPNSNADFVWHTFNMLSLSLLDELPKDPLVFTLIKDVSDQNITTFRTFRDELNRANDDFTSKTGVYAPK